MTALAWTTGIWLNPPPGLRIRGERLEVECAEGSDFWADTHYGFHRHSGHALLVPFEVGQSIEVDFLLDYQERYDQAGVLVRSGQHNWLKAGVEISDQLPQVGAVATRLHSDWSCAPVPRWEGSIITVRVSRTGDALIVRARKQDEQWQLVRVAPFSGDSAAVAGPYAASPERAGLAITFTRMELGAADKELHLP